jgi:RNA polymerase sigma factor (sigma-70 family)
MSQNKAIELAKNICAGNRQSVELFYKMHVPIFWKTIYPFAYDEADARSMFNLGMLKILEGLPKFDFSRALWPWMKTILIHSCIDEVRGRNRFLAKNELFAAQDLEVETKKTDQLESEEMIEILQILPEIQRTILILHIIEDFSHLEIAQKLGISAGNSRWYLHQARLNFKKILENSTFRSVHPTKI